ncbi:hypothetical protein BDV93DRAFT_519931 [Ceratobasidium sp. AG-I]|nr:hypothetical protein BDV93DRAFT_519931 [Ceratobasidium sp. AG-I]
MASIRVSAASPSPPMSPSPATARTPPPPSPLTSTILRATGTIADLSRTLADLSSPDYRPSDEAERTEFVCCCRDSDCPVSHAWESAERKLVVSAEVGQALLERHEAFTRRHEAFVKQNESQTEHIASLNLANAALREEVATHTRLEKRLAQSQLNLDAADATNRTLTKELQDARTSISRLSIVHARGVGLDTKLQAAVEEREDLRREATEAANRARMWETRANEAGSRCRKLQAEVTQLREETDSIKLSRSEISSDILEDARARLQMLQSSLGHMLPPSDDPEITRMLEALVADNEALKRDAAELQNMLTESREDARTLQEDINEMRARGEGGQEALAEDATDMSFTRSTPPPYNTAAPAQGHGRKTSVASTSGRSVRSGWAASFATHAQSPRVAAFAPGVQSSGANTPTASLHSPRAASFSGSANRVTSPPIGGSSALRRITSPRAVPPLVIPPMRRRVVRANSVDGVAIGITRATEDDFGSENPLSADSSGAFTSPNPYGLVPPHSRYRRASAENSATSERYSPIPSLNEVDDTEDQTRVDSVLADLDGKNGNGSIMEGSDMNASILVADAPESPEKPKPQRRPLMLLSRSRGIQTEDIVPQIRTHSHSPTPAPIPSPRPGSMSFTSSDAPSSPIIGPALPLSPERLATLLSRLQHSDVRGLSARLKRQNLAGADLAHLSRSTLRAIATDVRTELGTSRGALGRTIREMLGEIITLRGVVNDVALDPNAAARVREEAFTGTDMVSESGGLVSVVERGRQRLMRSQSSAMGWIAAPISKFWSGAAEGGEAGQGEVGLAGGKKRLAPRVAPAISTSTTTVNVEFASTGTRRAVSTMVVAPDTIATPPVETLPGREPSRGPGDSDARKEQLRGIFVGSQLARAKERERVESWVILPSTNSRRTLRAAQSTMNINAGDATIRIRDPADLRRLSRNVDAVIDAPQDSTGQDQLLQRALRPRGLSDSSIRSTFISHGEGTIGRNPMHRVLTPASAIVGDESVEIASSSYDHMGLGSGAVIAPPPTAIPKSGTGIPFRGQPVVYASTSTSESTSTSPARAIPARKLAAPSSVYGTATGPSSIYGDSAPGSLISGPRFPRRSAWAGILSDEEDSFQAGSFKEGVSFSGGVVRHRDRASGRGISEDMA